MDNDWRKFRAVPRSYPSKIPLSSTLFKRGGNRRAFRLPKGRAGDHFHCTVELSPGHITVSLTVANGSESCKFRITLGCRSADADAIPATGQLEMHRRCSRRSGRGRGAGRVSAANWGILGGGGLNFFFLYFSEMSPRKVARKVRFLGDSLEP